MPYIHQINTNDPDNTFGYGLTASVFFNYCSKHCPECWNVETWARDESLFVPTDTFASNVRAAVANTFIYGGKRNLALLGGDPMEDENVEDALHLVQTVGKEFLEPLRVGIWTGDVVETYLKDPERYKKQLALLALSDILIDGPYMRGLRTRNMPFGSINQRVLDAKKVARASLDGGEVNVSDLLAPQASELVLTIPRHKESVTMEDAVNDFENSESRSYARYLLERFEIDGTATVEESDFQSNLEKRREKLKKFGLM